MSRISTTRKSKLDLDDVIDAYGNNTKVLINKGNKITLRFPPGSVYDPSRTDDMNITITLKLDSI